ncbi:MAG: hypothetical protein HUU60_06315 [Armatimonadetes bacterium]|nr:hypothetical protein [Armatimonadota bacterium]
MKRSRWLAAVACLALLQTSPGQLVELWRTFPNTDQYPRPSLTTGVVDEEGNVTMGGSVSGTNWMLVVRFDHQGNQQWYRAFNFGTSEAVLHTAISPTGAVLCAGIYMQGSSTVALIMLLDSMGQLLASATGPAIEDIGIQQMAEGPLFLFTGTRSAIVTRSYRHDLTAIWSAEHTSPFGQPYIVRSGRANGRCIVRNCVLGGVATSVIVLRYSNTGALEYDFALGDFDESFTDQGKIAIPETGPSSVGTFARSGQTWRNSLLGLDDIGAPQWHQMLPPNGQLYASGFKIWTDPYDRLLASWFDGGGDQYLLHFDKETGDVIGALLLPKPRVRHTELYYYFASDERGAYYIQGSGYDLNNTNRVQMVLKLDRNFRPVWFTYLDMPLMHASWVRYDRGNLYMMMGGIALPPLVKYKILAVRSEGDVSGDGCVDDKDLAMALEAFGTSDPSADLNGDGIVDDLDLEEVLHNFGLGCE